MVSKHAMMQSAIVDNVQRKEMPGRIDVDRLEIMALSLLGLSSVFNQDVEGRVMVDSSGTVD
ncbi:MAG: hypothetical protein H6813_06685 [Phycisphaeraceae bacterium]|nr:hypothetical protein [Phycisphaeraceae bacterium]MCB9848157.1 hypothetical protein [Phycisphaeraceae bacterium]